MTPFKITEANGGRVPIVVSIPHSGVAVPKELKDQFKKDLLDSMDDTDWFVDKLYDFAPSMGITMISAVFSRWVIDLNRDPSSKPLYTDGRLMTGLCPLTTFTGEKLYDDDRENIPDSEVKTRIEKYFDPYHKALDGLLQETKKSFGKVLLWDCHSIRQHVPSIHPKRFPDLILGNNDGFSAGGFLTEMASKSLTTGGGYTFENNFLFKGGFITRHFGQPGDHQHALQLEMTKVNYMDDAELKYDDTRASRMRDHLRRTFEKLITVLSL
jgi:N-formylglutamate deformylase